MSTPPPNDIHVLLAGIWFLIVGLFLVLYVVLDGFDLGVGMLSLFADEKRRSTMMLSLGSIWDANETWIVVLGGTLFGAFPLAYGTVLHALYVPIVLMLLGFMLRGVSFEFHALSRRKAFWGILFGIGSLLAAVAQGFALGGMLAGIDVENRVFVGSIWDWISPFSAVVVVGVITGYSLLGAGYLIIKTSGNIQTQCYRYSRSLAWSMLAVALIVTVWTPLRYPQVAARWFTMPDFYLFAALPLLAAGAFLMLLRALRRRYEFAPFVWTLLIFLFSFLGLAASLYPYIVPGSVTVDQAAADSNTLVFMLIGIGMLIPVMLAYNAYQYVVFRGKVAGEGY